MRPRGGIIGATVQPAATALNSAASGVWTLRESNEYRRAGAWPRMPASALLAVTFDNSFDDQAQNIAATQTSSGVSRSTAQVKGGSNSLFVNGASSDNFSTTARLLYGSGSQWDIAGSDFTIECWFYCLSSGLNAQGLITRDAQPSSRHFQLVLSATNNLRFRVFNTSATGWIDITDPSAASLNSWIHVAAVRDGSVFRLYRDGVQVGSQDVSTASGTRATASGSLCVGSVFDNGTFSLSGYIDEVLVSSACLYRNGTTFTPRTQL